MNRSILIGTNVIWHKLNAKLQISVCRVFELKHCWSTCPSNHTIIWTHHGRDSIANLSFISQWNKILIQNYLFSYLPSLVWIYALSCYDPSTKLTHFKQGQLISWVKSPTDNLLIFWFRSFFPHCSTHQSMAVFEVLKTRRWSWISQIILTCFNISFVGTSTHRLSASFFESVEIPSLLFRPGILSEG